jgi:hypothetical protein
MGAGLRERALNALAHPAAIAAACVLLLNAAVWQRSNPSWWTGKIGDAAWLVIVPSLLLLLFSFCVPSGLDRRSGWGAGAILLTGLAYSRAKASPPVNALALAAVSRLGFTPKLLLDPSDLVALPALTLAWIIWRGSDANGAPARVVGGRVDVGRPRLDC